MSIETLMAYRRATHEAQARAKMLQRTRPKPAIVRCKRCKTARRIMVILDGIFYEVSLDKPLAQIDPCQSCGKYQQLHLIEGRVTDSPCDHRCTDAKGPSCDCKCGGFNHGIAYA